MRVSIGRSWRKELDDDKYLDISVYDGKWLTDVHMSLWERDNGRVLKATEKTLINYDKFLPTKIAEVLGRRNLNKQSQRTANVNIV